MITTSDLKSKQRRKEYLLSSCCRVVNKKCSIGLYTTSEQAHLLIKMLHTCYLIKDTGTTKELRSVNGAYQP